MGVIQALSRQSAPTARHGSEQPLGASCPNLSLPTEAPDIEETGHVHCALREQLTHKNYKR